MPALNVTWAMDFTNTGPAAGDMAPKLVNYWPCLYPPIENSNSINDAWAQYANMYIPAGVNQISLHYSALNGLGDKIEVLLDPIVNGDGSLSGTPIATQTTMATYPGAAGETDTCNVTLPGNFQAGLHDVYIEFVQSGSGPSGDMCDLDWFQFGSTSPPIAAPASVTAAEAAGLSMTVTWPANSTNFVVQRSTDNQNFVQINAPITNSNGSSSCTDTGLTNGTTYYYRVCEYDACYGDSAYASSPGAAWAMDLYWVGGSGGAAWSTNNWGATSNGGGGPWSDGYVAVFNTSGAAVTILSGTVNPAEIDFENTGSTGGDTISGAGSIRCPTAAASFTSPMAVVPRPSAVRSPAAASRRPAPARLRSAASTTTAAKPTRGRGR